MDISKKGFPEIPKVEDLAADAEFLFFWSHRAQEGQVTKACLSQWWPCEFRSAEGVIFNCAEQFMMASKAMIMNDEETRKMIMATADPREMKRLGRIVRNYDEKVWHDFRWSVVLTGNYLKFSQNPELKDFLLSTGDKVLVEASPYDRIWGIGMGADDPSVENPKNWKGLNLLGFALTEVKKHFKQTL